MDTVDRLRAEIQETQQLLELARQQLRLTTLILPELYKVHRLSPQPVSSLKRKRTEVYTERAAYVDRYASTVKFVEETTLTFAMTPRTASK